MSMTESARDLREGRIFYSQHFWFAFLCSPNSLPQRCPTSFWIIMLKQWPKTPSPMRLCAPCVRSIRLELSWKVQNSRISSGSSISKPLAEHSFHVSDLYEKILLFSHLMFTSTNCGELTRGLGHILNITFYINICYICTWCKISKSIENVKGKVSLPSPPLFSCPSLPYRHSPFLGSCVSVQRIHYICKTVL